MQLAESARYTETRWIYFHIMNSWKDLSRILTVGSHKRVSWYVESISVYVDMWQVILEEACLVADSGGYDLLHFFEVPRRCRRRYYSGVAQLMSSTIAGHRRDAQLLSFTSKSPSVASTKPAVHSLSDIVAIQCL